MSKYILIFNTFKYLKFVQIYYRIFYSIRNSFYKVFNHKYKFSLNSHPLQLHLKPSIEGFSVCKDKEFRFLNLVKKFDIEIDWNYQEYGKLWTYNLNYFEYLQHKRDIFLIYDFIDNIEHIKDGIDAFPISLRTINWIKFIIKYDIKDKKIDDSLYAQQYILLNNLEYHLLGNHLLENGFALLFSAYYFNDKRLYKRAKSILLKELDTQILEDGAHFELSPMYHKIMLFKVLDCIHLIQNNNVFYDELLDLLQNKAKSMLGWLKEISYNNGDVPNFNDSTNSVAPSTYQLESYAHSLNISSNHISLKESGYRKFSNANYECIIDIADIKATYISGHSHADTFNFELRLNNQEFIVDCGISTYEHNDIRYFERSTKAHNCVEINKQNSSDVWSSFRVADRAKVIKLTENDTTIIATHDGYKKYGILHNRQWTFDSKRVIIIDSLNQESDAMFRLHFHPNVDTKLIEKTINISEKYNLSTYKYAYDFNKRVDAIMLEVSFSQYLKTIISI